MAQPNAAGRVGVGIILANKYVKLVITHGTIYEDRVVWIKFEEVEGGNIGIAYIYAPNIPTKDKHCWHLTMDFRPKTAMGY